MLLELPDTRAAAQLAATSDHSMLERTTAAVMSVTGARSAFMERVTVEPDVVEVVATLGQEAPPLGFGPRASRGGHGSDAYVLPLLIDDQLVGNVVAIGVPRGIALSPALPGQLEMLACVGALALRNLGMARELELATTAAMERKFRVMNGIVHYLKDVLGAAGEYAQLLDTDTNLTPRQAEYIAGSRRNIDTALRLMSELLEMARVDTGRVRLEWEPVDVAAVVRGILRDYQLANGTTGLQFDARIEPGLMRIRTDVDMLRRILDALLSNAVRYTPADGTVTITTGARIGRRSRDPGHWICVSVSDSGPGVAERDQVFEEVARAEAIASSPGFRLAISRRLARLLGGDLTLETNAGRGSTFTLWLPLVGLETSIAAAGVPRL